MDFSQRQRDPRRHLAGMTFVVLFHAAIVYALLTGLAKKVVDVVRAPIETKVIEEVKKPPPPPETVVPPPPRLEAPPPPFIPPPEVQVATPPPPAPTITAVSPVAPPAPVAITPVAPAPVAPAPAPPPAAPVKTDVGVVCAKQVKPEAPAVAFEGNVNVVVRYTIQGGKVVKVDLVRFSGPSGADRKAQRAFMAAIDTAAREYGCSGDAIAEQEFAFTIK